MRDINRSRMAAAARSRRATPKELREARARVKEIDAELRGLELSPETKHGEEREQRYERVLRLRQMRDDFTSRFPSLEQRNANSLVLAVAMTVMSLLTCVFCAGGSYFAYSALTYNPGPSAVATSYWSDLQGQSYQDAYSNMLSSTLRNEITQQQFLADAQQADSDYGVITSAKFVSQTGNLTTSAKLVYKVTRQKKGAKAIVYNATIQMTAVGAIWGVNDVGASIYPTLGGVPPVATDTPTATPTAGQ